MERGKIERKERWNSGMQKTKAAPAFSPSMWWIALIFVKNYADGRCESEEEEEGYKRRRKGLESKGRRHE